jgi:hypothetical protein
VRWLAGSIAVGIVGLYLSQHLWWRTLSWAVGSVLVWSVALPLAILALGARKWMVALVVALALGPLSLSLAQNLSASHPTFLQRHDGGVLVTGAAADQAAHGRNPYTADFSPVLGHEWHIVHLAGGNVANPVATHEPYLPASFLVNVPPMEVAHAVGLGWDPRILYVAVVALAVALVLLEDAPLGVRLAMVCGVGNALVRDFTAWGTNDAVAGCLFLVALLLAAKRPRWAGVALAVAVSFKFLLLMPAIPLLALVVRRDGWAGLRKWWTAPATLVATSLPFLVAAPRAFVQDTVLYNFGLTKDHFPTTGLGLPAVAGQVFHGPLLGLVTLGLFALGIAGPIWAVRRWPTTGVASLAGAFALLCLLVPARTFQVHYLVMVAVLAAGGWLAVRPPRGLFDRPAPQVEADPAT